MDGEARIAELERGFRHDGLPNLIEDRTATKDVFPRTLPFLMLVFFVETVAALGAVPGWERLLVSLGVVGAVLVGFGVLNLTRGARFVSFPRRIEPLELGALVLLPGVLLLIQERPALAFWTVVANALLLIAATLAIGFGLLAILRWAFGQLFVQLEASVGLLVRAMPLLLFFSLISFFTTEIWQVFTSPGPATFWTAIGIFVVLGMGFLVVRLPGLVREVEADSDIGDVPLRKKERLNLAVVALMSQSLQVFFVSGAVWLFYVVLGSLLVTADVRDVWLTQPEHVIFHIAYFGERIDVTSELLRVATGVAAFAGLYYAVTILVDSAHRDQFIDGLTKELHTTFGRRREYHELLAGRSSSQPMVGA